MSSASIPFAERLALVFDRPTSRRIVGGESVIIHCHHYNSRIQNTIEGARAIDGQAIFRDTAREVFDAWLDAVLTPESSSAERLAEAIELYRHLGFGALDLGAVSEGRALASSSHFAEGRLSGFPARERPACTFTEGFLEAALRACLGASVRVREVECIAAGAKQCRFTIEGTAERARTGVAAGSSPPDTTPASAEPGDSTPAPRLRSPHVDEEAIIAAVAGMPIVGDAEGLIPAFNVYLANMPAEFYNLVCFRFLAAMRAVGQHEVARDLLLFDAETCGLLTFGGIVASPEWDAVVAPMLHERDDAVFGIVAVSNALGWGHWHVTALESGRALTLAASNGYESSGYRRHFGVAAEPKCLMLTGVAAGIAELIYGEGLLEERFGSFGARECSCRACADAVCTLEAVAA